jgi:hypothetical protein
MAFQLLSTDFAYHDEQVSYSEGSWGSEATYRLVRRVKRRNNNAIDLVNDIDRMVVQGVLPQPMQRLTTNVPAITRRTFDTMRCAEFGYSVDAAGFTLTANILYTTPYFVDGVVSTSLILPSSSSYQTVTRIAKVYRTGWATDPPLTADTTTDIGGTAIQGAGATATMLVPQVRFRITVTQDASVSANYMNTIANGLAAFIGTRNSASFGPFATGSLVCEGINITQTRMPYYDVTADYLYDDWGHHEQVAETGIDGRPNYSAGNLAAVRWKRPALLSSDFNLIFGSPTPNTQFQNRTIRGWVS